MRILIVEDDFDARLMLQMSVEGLGQCDMAVNGNEAVRAFQLAHSQGRPYDLILLDIMLPELNGREALSEMRRLEDELGLGGKQRVPVIMVSALDDAENIIGSFFKEGCEAYLTKPYRRESLLNEIKKLGLT
jgi:two-component system, chemotaxis family, chemotaxis protein CheY